MGSPLQQYKQKIRLPRIRTPGTLNNNYYLHFTLYNVSSIAFDLSFPEELTTYGLSEAMLNKVFTEVENYKRPLSWCVKGISFYQVLHQFLKRWPRSKSSTKSSIGRFYMAIDKNLQAKGCRPDNTYLFIEKVALSSQSSQSSLMCYGNEKLEEKMLQCQVKECCENIEQMMKDFGAMSEE